ncbi:MAG: antitoxin [Verrucomicrobiota bacterium]|nr:antitoxin [Verrucomicrobiota bacterium]
MSTLTIKSIDAELVNTLKDKARKTNTSLNSCVLKILRQGTEVSKKQFSVKYDDLDSLAGTWTEEEYKEFNANTKSFSQIDKGLWK